MNPIEQKTKSRRSATEATAADGPVVIEARGIEKAFRIPEHKVDSLKERAVHPLRRPSFRQLKALDGISFDVHQGEFFGIVGRNGSGKSTLLKILASIYRADAGTIRMAGRLAPFIELGVGFNADLSARENVILNAVMMGLTPTEARGRLDAVFEFAELQEFTELKLKNYSSGMMVRLAFSVMIQADADILLIDEVLAVGDASFQQKCADVFHEMRDSTKTVILVTHDMATVESYCGRAMLLDDGRMIATGKSEEISRQYLKLNFDEASEIDESADKSDTDARVVDSWLENAAGERSTNIEQGDPIRIHTVIEGRRRIVEPLFSLVISNKDGIYVSSFVTTLDPAEGERDEIASGARLRLSATIDNPLAAGRFYLTCWVGRNHNPGDVALRAVVLLSFVVYGTVLTSGIVALPAEFTTSIESESGA